MFWNLNKIKKKSEIKGLERKLEILKTYSTTSRTTDTDTIKGTVLIKTSYFKDDMNSMFASEKLYYLNSLLNTETSDQFFNKFKITMIFDNSYLFSDEQCIETFKNLIDKLIEEKIEQLEGEIYVLKCTN